MGAGAAAVATGGTSLLLTCGAGVVTGQAYDELTGKSSIRNAIEAVKNGQSAEELGKVLISTTANILGDAACGKAGAKLYTTAKAQIQKYYEVKQNLQSGITDNKFLDKCKKEVNNQQQ